MHKKVIEISFLRSDILLRCKSCKSLLENENSQRIDSKHKRIDTEIELQIIYEVGFRHVPLSYKLFVWLDFDVFKSSHKVNPSALAQVHWLNDKRFVGLLAELIFKVVTIVRQLPSFWEEIIVFLTFFHHSSEVFG